MTQRAGLFFIATAFAALTLFAATCAAQDIRRGRLMQVKPNSIWFQDRAQLTRWQQLRKSGDDAALKSYEHDTLGSRDAWQFINEMTVRVKSHDAAKHQVDLEMKTPGRFLGSTWILDADALETTHR